MEERELIEKLVTYSKDIEENKETILDHENRIKKLEDSTAILQKMDYRMGKVETAVESMSTKLDAKINEQNKKKADWLDYIFKGILTIALGYIAVKLGLQ